MRIMMVKSAKFSRQTISCQSGVQLGHPALVVCNRLERLNCGIKNGGISGQAAASRSQDRMRGASTKPWPA
jgi:hypothetical protein